VNTINVETAQQQVFTSKNINGSDAQVVFLLTGQQVAQSAPPVVTGPPSGGAGSGTSTPIQPRPTVDQSSPGLYAGSAYPGQMDLYEALDWIALNAQTGGVYSIVLGSDQKVSNVIFDYENKKVTVSLKAVGGERKVTFETDKPSYPLFTVKAGTTFTLEENVILSGVQNAGVSLIMVDGGTFIMNGGAIRDNNKKGDGERNGGGVYVNAGSFIMNNGVISGNTASSGGSGNPGSGGGVYVKAGSFTMNGGAISGNTASSGWGTIGGGGGVCVAQGATFTKSSGGGIIYGSNAPEGQANKTQSDGKGHAVYVESGSKKRDTTARATTAMDSTKKGPEGGWD
jgi:hypothetical protein